MGQTTSAVWFVPLFLSLVTSPALLAKKKDPVIATVNGSKILKSEFLKRYRQNKLFVSSQEVSKESVLDDMISKVIGVQRAKKNKLHLDPTVNEKIEDILYHAQISKDLEGKLQKIKVSDLDVKNYYKKNKEYRTAQVLLRVKAEATKKEVSQTRRVAEEIYKKAKASPDDFGKLANKYTQTGNAKTGGDMGFQPPSRYAPEYFSAINGQSAGHITKPVRTQFGFHIIKILGVKEFKDINLGVYKKIVYDQKRDAILKKYFKDLKRRSKVSVNKKVLKSI